VDPIGLHPSLYQLKKMLKTGIFTYYSSLKVMDDATVELVRSQKGYKIFKIALDYHVWNGLEHAA
jgi:hypothetical protein